MLRGTDGSPLEDAVAAAIARFKGAELRPEQRRELAKFIHRTVPGMTGYEPKEERLAQKMLDEKIGACCDVLKRFRRDVAAGRENEAIAVLKEFMEAAYSALVAINLVELERQMIALGYAANRLSLPPPIPSLDEQVRGAMAMGWSGEEIEMLPVDLRRDDSGICQH